MRFPQVTLLLPDWMEDMLSEEEQVYPAIEDRVRFAIELSRSNIRHGSGGLSGPQSSSGGDAPSARPRRQPGSVPRLLCLPCGDGGDHDRQSVIGDFDLGGAGCPSYELVASTEPCAWYLGATPWSGVRHLMCGARGEDAGRAGFDEGVMPAERVPVLERRGSTVGRDVLRNEATSVLREYAEKGGEIYNARRGGS
jgi:hypothetical protein